MVSATTLYGSEVWAWRYCEELEKVQSQYYKALLFLPRSTPGHYLRIELGISKLKLTVLKNMLALWCKILKLDDCRYSRICYNQLLKMMEMSFHNTNYNWCSQLFNILHELDFVEVWERQDVQFVQENFQNILDKMENVLKNQDVIRIQESHYNSSFQYVMNLTCVPTYLKLSLPLFKLRFLAQLRLAGEKFSVISVGEIKSSFNNEHVCDLCNTKTDDTIYHFFCYCPVLGGIRQTYFNFKATNLYYFLNIVKSLGEDEALIEVLISFYIRSAKERNFIKGLYLEFDEN